MVQRSFMHCGTNEVKYLVDGDGDAARDTQVQSGWPNRDRTGRKPIPACQPEVDAG
jgi:hypothetical protein